MTEYEKAIQEMRTKGNVNYFPLNTLTDKELLNALRWNGNTPFEREAITEEILERMAR
jgi:hypothetical protein